MAFHGWRFRRSDPTDGVRAVKHKTKLHYEEQTEAEAVAEDEAAFGDQTQTVLEIPTELVPAVRELIARHGS